jgi:hypothetical protein
MRTSGECRNPTPDFAAVRTSATKDFGGEAAVHSAARQLFIKPSKLSI